MPLSISKDRYLDIDSGVALRFTVKIHLTRDDWVSKEGYLAIRQVDGHLKVLPPAQTMFIAGKKVRYRNERVSDSLTGKMSAHIEKMYGAAITIRPEYQEEYNEKQAAKQARQRRSGKLLDVPIDGEEAQQ